MSRVAEGAPDLILASASPRRLDLLRIVGLEPTVLPADVDETPLNGEKPRELVERLARAKAERVHASVGSGSSSLVIAADTVIDIDGEVFGKPTDDVDAARMLRALRGRAHDVLTGIAVVGHVRNGADDELLVRVGVGRVEVWLRSFGDAEIDWYVASGEPRGKAGAYAIQGIGSVFVDRIEGNYQSVVGLSLPLLDDLFVGFGWSLRELSAL